MTERDDTSDVEPDVEPTLAAARRAEPSWTVGRQQQLKWALMARLDQRRRPAALICAPISTLAGLALVVAGGLGWYRLASKAPVKTAIATAASGDAPFALDRALPRLADGSSIVLDGPTAILKTMRDSSDEVVVQLEAGGAHFEVARRPSRIFRVQAGPVTVQVIGTRFHVRRDGVRTRISVDRGRVLASWWGGSRELGPGEEGTFPPDGVEAEAPAGEAPATVAPRATAEDRAQAVVAPAAPAASRRVTSRVVASPPPTPEALFALADRARTAGRPEAAVAHLREIVDRYPRDPHASMAAFTEGRLLLETLGRPRDAAGAFERARALAKDGPLAEDALARQVEALHAAGDVVAARDLAERYRELFPHGHRLSAVMRFGGLQASP